MRLPKGCVPVVAAIVCAGCGAGSGAYQPVSSKPVKVAAVEPGTEESLFPFKVGNQWTYVVEVTDPALRRASVGEITLRIAKISESDNGKLAEIEIVDPNGTVSQVQGWQMSKDGIYQTSAGKPSVSFEPAQPSVKFPVKTGDTFEWSGKGLAATGNLGNSQMKSKVLEPQEVDTENERVSAIPIETIATFTEKGQQGTMRALTYWTPGIGIVRYWQEVTVGPAIRVQVMKLKASVVK